MEWTELTPISEENLNDLEGRIEAANQNVLNAKTPVAASITAKGVTASSADTFSQLAGKIDSIQLALGDAVVGDVLEGKTFSKLGSNGLTGTMPNLAGDSAALASSVVGTTLKLRSPKGFKDGIDDNVTITDADFIDANISDGVSVLGKMGTMPNQINIVANTTRSTTAIFPAFVELKKVTVYKNGTFTVSFEASATGGYTTVRIYLNGVYTGLQGQTNLSSYSIYNHSLAVVAGDVISLMVTGDATTTMSNVRNFSVKSVLPSSPYNGVVDVN